MSIWHHKICSLALIAIALLSACSSAPPKPQRSEQDQARLVAAIERAQGDLSQGRDELAQQQLLAIMEQFPDYPGAYVNMGLMRLRQQRCSDALVFLDQAIALDKRIAAAHNARGVCLRQLERFAEAERAYLAALDADSGYAMAHRNIAMLYELYYQDLEQALKHYKRYKKLSSDDEAQAWINDIKYRMEAD